jgi:hypothetical protein
VTDQERLDRLYLAARDVVVDPHDMEKRRRFVSLTFNIDRLAVAIVELGDRDPDRDLKRVRRDAA